MKTRLSFLFGSIYLLLALGLITGCTTKRGAGKDYVFFPPPPDEPRLQFLMGFGTEAELGQANKFADFVVGQDKLQRPFWKPYGVTATKGTLYVVDTQAANVGIVDLIKRKIRYIRPAGREAMQTPVNVAVGADGKRYVTDTKRNEVIIYNKEGRREGTLGRPGEMKPCGVFAAGGKIYVTDLQGHAVRVYRADTQELLLTIPRDPKDEKSRLHSPTNITADQDGNIYVSDTGGFSVKLYDAQGNHLRTIGEQGLEPGRFAMPKGVAVDREKRLYVVDGSTAVVQMFDREGRLLTYFGDPAKSAHAGLYLPAAIAVDYENVELFKEYVAPGFTLEHLIYVVNQAGRQKVAVYGFVRKG